MIWKSSYLLPRMLTLAALTVLPLVALHGYTLYAEYRRAEAATLRTLVGQAELAARTVDDALGLAQGQLRLAARRRAAQQGDALRCTSLLQSLDEESGLMTHFEVHAPDGRLMCGSQSGGSSASAGQVPQPWVGQVLSGQGPWLSEPQELESDGSEPRRHVVRLALALDSGLARGPEVLSVLVDLQQLSERLSPTALPPGSVLTLYDRHWHVMARNPDLQDWVGRSAPGVGGAHTGSGSSVIRAFGVDGVERVHASSALRHGGLRVTAGAPVAALRAPLTDQTGRAVVVGILVLCGSLGLAAYWSGIVSRSLRRLAQAAAHLAGGRQGVQIDEKLPGELGALASQFNLMLQALQARSHALEASQHQAVRFGQLNQVLSEAAHAVARSPQPQQLFERICRICVDTGQAKVAWICIDGHPVARAASLTHADDALLQAPFVEGDGRTDLGVRWHERCASGEPLVENDLAKAVGGDDVQPLLLEHGVGSVASLPFLVRGRHAGNLNMYADAPGFFDDTAVGLLKAVAADLGFALDAQEQEKARIEAEQALAQREQQLAGIIDTAMDAIITIDASYRIVVFNRAAADMFMVKPEEAVGATLDRFVPTSVRAAHPQLVERFAQDGQVRLRHHGAAMRFRGVRANGEEFPLDAMLVKQGRGEDLLMTAVLRDVTTFEQAEAAKEAEARAAAASRAKTEFISHMSHELRTPLNAVLGFSQLLQGTARKRLTPKELQQLDMIFLAGAQLRSLIEEALDLSRIEAGRVDLRMEAVELCALVQELMLLLEPLAQEQGVRLLMPPEPATPVHASTDRSRVRQVLLNILSNAIKYNRRSGTVTVTLREAGEEVEIEVADTGLGMSAEQLKNLFEPFNRLGREGSGIEGTGIGMALTRRLVELLDGSLSVSSEPDVGTSVRVRLPRVQPERPAAVTVPAAQPEAVRDESAQAEGPRGRVLYVEDNPVNVILVQALLEHWRGVELLTAPDVETGVRMARASPPDLVLLDMHLGTASGHDFLARVRSDSRTATLRVVALSASAMPDDVNAARQAGVMDYWTKPLDAQEFRAGISRLLSGSG